MRKLALLGPLTLLLALGLAAAPAAADHCSVNTHCSNGSTISCTGSQTCSSQNGQWVECDGQRTYCPVPPCTAEVWCDDGTYLSCMGSSPSSCQEDSCLIYCDGQRYACPGYETVFLCPAW